MATVIGNIEVYMGPSDAGAPDDLEKVIVDFINGAQKKLQIAVQELESDAITKAIISARQKNQQKNPQRKLEVELVLEQDYLLEYPPLKNPWNPNGKHEPNRIMHNALLRSNVDVKVDYNTSIFHQKFIVRDGASVLTGSTNFTPTGVKKNLNHVIIIHDTQVARIYAREFREIQQGRFGKLNEGHDKAPAKVNVSSIPVKVLFAPDHNPEMEIMKQMLKAKERIDFAIFTFFESSGIDDTMLCLLDFGRPIRGVFDQNQGMKKWSPIKKLKQKKAELYIVPKSGKIGKLHHKLMVLDEQVVIAGSFNYTGPANRLNDENIIILGDLCTTDKKSTANQKKIGRAVNKEIDRIIKDHGKTM